MNFLSRLGNIISRVGAKLSDIGARMSSRGARQSLVKRVKNAKNAPSDAQARRSLGNRVKQAQREKASRPRSGVEPPDHLPEPVPPEEMMPPDVYDEYAEYRAQLTSLMSYFDFDEELIAQMQDADLDLFAGEVDWVRLNGVIEQLDGYKDRYAAGDHIPDYDYYINELNESIPGLNLTKTTSENWLTIGL